MPQPRHLERRKGAPKLTSVAQRSTLEHGLTTDAPVGRVRATVRQGRDEMRAKLLGWLPSDLSGAKILDAGCGTGALAVELASRGAHVVTVDLSEELVDLYIQEVPLHESAWGLDRLPRGETCFGLAESDSTMPSPWIASFTMRPAT